VKKLLQLILILAVISPGVSLASQELTCRLESTNNHWIGPCGKYNGKHLSLNIHVAESITSGVWRSDTEPTEVWAGTMDYGKTVSRLVEIEHYDAGVVIARTTFGWFKVSDWSQSDDGIDFAMHTGMLVAPSKLDLLIVRRAGEILAHEKAWNRKDNRKCPQEASKWSIYCAMRKASVDVSGGSHHRRPALQVVRETIKQRSKSRRYKHLLMDYNNDKKTQIEDVHSVFTEAGEIIIHSLLFGENQ
jgi:hypothetical protein